MNKERNQEILESLERYDKCRLECDGLSRVLSYILTANHIEHEVWVGEIIVQPQVMNLPRIFGLIYQMGDALIIALECG